MNVVHMAQIPFCTLKWNIMLCPPEGVKGRIWRHLPRCSVWKNSTRCQLRHVFTFAWPALLTQLSLTCFTLNSNYTFFLNHRNHKTLKCESLKYVVIQLAETKAEVPGRELSPPLTLSLWFGRHLWGKRKRVDVRSFLPRYCSFRPP